MQPLAEFALSPVNRPNVDQEIKINEHLSKAGAKIPIADELSRFGRRAVDPKNPDDLPMTGGTDPYFWDFLTEELMQHYPRLLESSVANDWVGYRAEPRDYMPVLGPTPGLCPR